MPLDQMPIGALAAALMDEIEHATGDEGAIGAVCLIVEANTPDGQSRVFYEIQRVAHPTSDWACWSLLGS